MARGFDDFLQRDLKIYNSPRALIAFLGASIGFVNGTLRFSSCGLDQQTPASGPVRHHAAQPDALLPQVRQVPDAAGDDRAVPR